jgi:hypothetical protein
MIVASGLALSAAPALATTTVNLYAVPSGGYSGPFYYPSECTQSTPCTLSWALTQSNTSPNTSGEAVVINLAPGTYTGAHTIQSSGGSPQSVELVGESVSGPGATVLTGGGTVLTLYVDDVGYEVTIKNLTLEDGNSGTYGGNVLASTSGGPGVTLDDDIVTGGVSTSGGQADVTAGTLTIEYSTVENSGTSVATFGSEATNSSTLEVTNSTYSGNSDTGIINEGTGDVSVLYSTVVGNALLYGVENTSTGMTTVLFSTVAGNASGGVYAEGGGTTGVGNSILASNADHDCKGSLSDDGYNAIDDSSCGFSIFAGSKVFTTSQIGLLPLANNGGPTETERITSSSAAYDFAPHSGFSCGGNDQRGIPYLQAGKTVCDTGPYQVAPPTLSAVSPASGEPGAPGNFELTGTNLVYATAAFGPANVPATVTETTGLTMMAVLIPRNLPFGSQLITVTNADGSATIPFTVTGPVIGASLPAAELDHPYSQALPISGGQLPESVSIVSGALPAGLTFSSSTGTISGTPKGPATASLTVRDVDAYGVTVTGVVTLSVLAPTIHVDSSKLKFKHSKATVDLTCQAAACSGKAEITKTTHVKVTSHHRTKTKTVTVVYASGSYSLAAGASGDVTITLTGPGHSHLASVATTPLHETVTATVLGGNTANVRAKVS